MIFPSLLLLLSATANLAPGVSAKAKAKTEDKPGRLGNSTIERTVQLRTHSLYAPYIDQDLQNRWWDFGADAYVNTNKHVRLTRNVPSQMGWLWSRLPLTASNYVIELEFKISGDSTHLHGDGIAIWLTTKRAQPGPIFGSVDKFDGLGIFLDTYANARHKYNFPRITAFVGDGKTAYDYGNDGDGTNIGSCAANYRRTNVATKLKITYVKNGFLDVKIQYKAWDDWSDCFRVEGVSLPAAPFLGFSALTGDVFDAHDIITIASHSAILSAPENQRDKYKPGPFYGQSEESTWFGTLFKLLVFGALCAGGWYGYKEYQRRKMYGGGMGGYGGRGGGYAGGMFAGNGKRAF